MLNFFSSSPHCQYLRKFLHHITGGKESSREWEGKKVSVHITELSRTHLPQANKSYLCKWFCAENSPRPLPPRHVRFRHRSHTLSALFRILPFLRHDPNIVFFSMNFLQIYSMIAHSSQTFQIPHHNFAVWCLENIEGNFFRFNLRCFLLVCLVLFSTQLCYSCRFLLRLRFHIEWFIVRLLLFAKLLGKFRMLIFLIFEQSI